MPNDNLFAHTKPPSNAKNIETKTPSNAEKANALASGLSFQSGWFQFVANLSASHPIIAAGAPEISRPTRTVKNNLSTPPVSHGGTPLPLPESCGIFAEPSQPRRTFRNSQVTIPPTTREKSNPIIHCLIFSTLTRASSDLVCCGLSWQHSKAALAIR